MLVLAKRENQKKRKNFFWRGNRIVAKIWTCKNFQLYSNCPDNLAYLPLQAFHEVGSDEELIIVEKPRGGKHKGISTHKDKGYKSKPHPKMLIEPQVQYTGYQGDFTHVRTVCTRRSLQFFECLGMRLFRFSATL